MTTDSLALLRRQRHLTAVLEDARHDVGADYACVHTFSRDGERLMCQATTRRLGGGRLTFAIDARESEACRQARATGRIVSVTDASTDLRAARVAHRRYGLGACLYTPLSLPGSAEAVMVFSRRRAHQWSSAQHEAAHRWGRKVKEEVHVELQAPPTLEELVSTLPGWWGIVDARGSWIDGRWSASDAPTLAQLITLPERGPAIASAIEELCGVSVPGERRTFTIAWRAQVYQVVMASLDSASVSICLLELGPPGPELFGEQEVGVRALVSGWNQELANALQILAASVDESAELAQAAQEVLSRGRDLSRRLTEFAGHALPSNPHRSRASKPGALHVLLVEDAIGVSRSIARVLRQAGHHVREAKSVEGAIEAIDAQVPDVLVLDLMLGDGTGADVLRATEGALGDTLVLGMTGYTEVDVLDAFECRQIPVLRKPFDPDDLLALVEFVA